MAKENVMEEKLNLLIESVESWLKAFDEKRLLEYFYVGKAENKNFEERWKIQSELTPRANVLLTPENFLFLTP